MQRNLAEGDTIKTKLGEATIKKIGPVQRSERSAYAWSMLTLDIAGNVGYCVAREDELMPSD